MAKNTICIWYDKDAEAAARFYAETCPDSAVSAVHRAPSDYPSGKKGDVLTVETRPGATWEKESKRAGKLTFRERITEYRDQDGELVITARGIGVTTERPVDQG